MRDEKLTGPCCEYSAGSWTCRNSSCPNYVEPCAWCNVPGHEDCSPTLTFDELLAKVSESRETIKKLLLKAIEDDMGMCAEYGGMAAWDYPERGYGLLWESISEIDPEEKLSNIVKWCES